ncbi:Alpha/Beta hydrolase protein [Fennellomyces sp. T-0311]|nr:Alpha/Beta hydrolase protein [Fennellomyces sp. T-0311]
MTAAERVEIPGQDPIIGLLNDNGTDKRLVLIAHGSPGHKDYYFFPLLAQRLPYPSFRFDFRGSGESGGEPRYNNMDDNVHDLHTVANYFTAKGYTIFAVIGHSRGAIAALKYAATLRETPLFHVVNIAARYKMGDSTRLKDSAKIALKEKVNEEQDACSSIHLLAGVL